MNRLHDLSKSQFNKFISELPIPIPSELNFDGQFHRFGEGEKGKEPHWYIGTQKGDDISFTVGSHKYPELKSSFQSKSKFSHPLWRRGSTLHEKWESCRLVDYHPYLDRKHISGLFGAKINFFGDLVIPMFSTLNDELIGLQTIITMVKSDLFQDLKKKVRILK